MDTADKIYRCEEHDYYAPCIYEITVSLENWQTQALGKIVVDAVDGRGVPTAAHCEKTVLGQAVADCWESIPKYYPEAKIICTQVMPEHFHGLIWVQKRTGHHLGQMIKGFKVGCNKAARVLAPATLSPQAGLWKDGFTDVILRHEGQLKNMFDYLAENPLRRAIKSARAGLFKSTRQIEVKGLWFNALGNDELLAGNLLQVQCSRRDFRYARVPKPGGGMKIARDDDGAPKREFASEQFAAKVERLLAAAENGATLISPCVSDGEREIARLALNRGHKLIAMRNRGFAPLEKPSGRWFDACAAGRLLLLAPAAWPYMAAEKPMTREDATAMNRLAQWLAGAGAAEINYHGIEPANIDAYARAAASARKDFCSYPII